MRDLAPAMFSLTQPKGVRGDTAQDRSVHHLRSASRSIAGRSDPGIAARVATLPSRAATLPAPAAMVAGDQGEPEVYSAPPQTSSVVPPLASGSDAGGNAGFSDVAAGTDARFESGTSSDEMLALASPDEAAGGASSSVTSSVDAAPGEASGRLPHETYDEGISAVAAPAPSTSTGGGDRLPDESAAKPGSAASLRPAPGLASSALPVASSPPATIDEDAQVVFDPVGRHADKPGAARFNLAAVSLARPAVNADEFGKRSVGDLENDPPQGIVPLYHAADGTVSLRLGDLIGLLEKQMERPLFVWLRSSRSASKYVTFETLRSAGLSVDYDPLTSRVVLSVAETAEQGARP